MSEREFVWDADDPRARCSPWVRFESALLGEDQPPRHVFPPRADACVCGALERPVVEVPEVTLFRPATGWPNSEWSIWRGSCGHVWDRRDEDTEHCPRCSAVLAALSAEAEK